MPRRREVPKREILPDPKFGNVTVAKFINMIMLSGKKAVAERLLYDAMDMIESKGKGHPVDVVEKALENVAPSVEVKSRRVGGATYQVPVEVRPVRRSSLAMRWLIEAPASAARRPWPRRWPVSCRMPPKVVVPL